MENSGLSRPVTRRVVSFRRGLIPSVSFPRLVYVVENESRYPEEVNKIYQELLQYGVLSRSKEGNYIPKSKAFSDFVVGPRLNDTELYFTTFNLCDGYNDAFNARFRRGSTKRLEVVSFGEYVIPSILSFENWGVIRVKFYDDKSGVGARILKFLQLKGIVTDIRDGNYSVFYKIGENQHPFNLNFHYGNEFFFTSFESAECFRQSLPPVLSYVLKNETGTDVSETSKEKPERKVSKKRKRDLFPPDWKTKD